jgi:hypothetical protein
MEDPPPGSLGAEPAWTAMTSRARLLQCKKSEGADVHFSSELIPEIE